MFGIKNFENEIENWICMQTANLPESNPERYLILDQELRELVYLLVLGRSFMGPRFPALLQQPIKL